MNINQKKIIKELKKAGFRDDEITISSPREIHAYEVSTSESKKTFFRMNGVAIDIKTKNKKLYDELHMTGHLLDNPVGNAIQRSSRNIFSFIYLRQHPRLHSHKYATLDTGRGRKILLSTKKLNFRNIRSIRGFHSDHMISGIGMNYFTCNSIGQTTEQIYPGASNVFQSCIPFQRRIIQIPF